MPRYNEGANLDPSEVQDVRGRRMAPIAIGGGGLGILVLVISMLLGVNPLDQVNSPSAGVQSPDAANLSQECRTGADAERRQDCRLVLFINSIQEYCGRGVQSGGGSYRPAQTQFFSGSTQTGCGTATSQVGPFYCPRDEMVYLDIDFFDELQRRFGARGGDFAEAYVLAHEYGHHVQNIIGTIDEGQRDRQGPQSGAVRVELQADCLAGVWANNATKTGYITELTETDIAQGHDAAAAVGDDRIQKAATGRVNPESWTHGSAAQRQKWFTTGYRSGTLSACDTFGGAV
jgi:predicted metalloprotease